MPCHGPLQSGLVTGIDVVLAHKFLGEFNAFAVGVCLSIPPAVLIEGAEGVDQDELRPGAKANSFFPST